MRIHILGIGSIGSLFAFHLRRSLPPDFPLSLIVRRRATQRHISQDLGSIIKVERDGHREFVRGFDPEIFEMASDMIYSLAFDKSGSSRLPDRNRTPGEIAEDEYQPGNFEKSSRSTPDIGTPSIIDSLLITCKAPATLPAIQRVVPRLHRHSTIVLLQNGMGVYDLLVERLFPDPAKRPHFVICTTSHGVWSKGPMDVVHAGVGDFTFGIVPDPLGRRDYERSFNKQSNGRLNLADISSQPNQEPEFATLHQTIRALLALTQLNPSWQPIENLQLKQLRKLTVNCCVNPLTALMDISNGELLGLTSAYKLIRTICDEASAVFKGKAAGELAALMAADEEAGQTSWTSLKANQISAHLSSNQLQEETMRVVGTTAKNYSSMLQDVRLGKPTEIEFMNGYLKRLGNKWGVPTPVNETMIDMIKLRTSLPKKSELPGLMKWWAPMGSWHKPRS